MRILHVNKFVYRRGGAEAYLLDLAAEQEAAGHTVALFGTAHPETPTDLPFRDRFPPYLPMNPPPASLVARGRTAAAIVHNRTARHAMAQVVEDFRPDVVHLHNIYQHLSPSILDALRDAAVPAVMTLHDYKLACPTYLLLADGRPCTACLDGHVRHAVSRRCKDGSFAASAMSAAEVWLHRRVDAYGWVGRFLCPSRFMLDVMRTAGIYPDRLVHQPGFVAAPPAPLPPRRRTVAYVGRLADEKGVDVVVRAAASLPDGVEVVIAGDGPAADALRAEAEASAPGRVRFTGRCDRARALEIIASAAVVVVPSRCLENQPIVILEAFSCGTPVVGSDLGGISELLGDDSGVLVAPDDPAALAAAVTRLLADPSLGRRLGDRGRARAADEFAPTTHVDDLTRIYDDVTDQTPRRRRWTASASR